MRIFQGTAFLLAIAAPLAGTALAQPSSDPAPTVGEAYTYAQCDSARSELAAMDTPQDRNSERAKALLDIYTSNRCQAIMAERAELASANPGMDSMLQMLREEGINIDSRMDSVARACRRNADPALSGEESEASVRDCTAKRQMIVYTEAINEMNASRRATSEEDRARYEAEVAAVERRNREIEAEAVANRDAYEERMAQWREAVRRCEQGELEYCAD